MKHLKTIISVFVLLMAVSCEKNRSDESGQVTFDLSGNWDITEVTKTNVSDYVTLPAAADFIITVHNAASQQQVWTGKISDWDETTELKAGDYTVTATYGNVSEEGFNKPFFTGTQTFTVTGGASVAVSVPVSLGNTIFKLASSQYFNNYYTDYTIKLTRDGSDIVTFSKGETRAAFIDGYKITVEGTLKSETGEKTFSEEYKGLEVATAYTYTMDVLNVGGSTISITFNNDVETVNLTDCELNDYREDESNEEEYFYCARIGNGHACRIMPETSRCNQ